MINFALGMEYIVFFFLPMLDLLFWSFKLLFKKERTRRQTMLMCLAILTIPYSVTYAAYCMPHIDYRIICMCERVGLMFIFLVTGALTLYLYMLRTEKMPRLWHAAFFIPGLIYGAVLNMLYQTMDLEDAARFLYLIDNDLPLPVEYQSKLFQVLKFWDLDLTLYISMVFLAINIGQCVAILKAGGYRFGNLLRFLLLSYHANPKNMIALFFILVWAFMMPNVLLLDSSFSENTGLCIFMACGCTLMMNSILLAEYHSDIESFTLYNLYYSKSYRTKRTLSEEHTQLLRSTVALTGTADATETDEPQADDDTSLSYAKQHQIDLIKAFRALMVDEELFRDADLTIEQVAQRLNVGRTTLSVVINKAYNHNFRYVLNYCRIRYAKEYMLSHTSSTQEQVAFACGYKDASAFSHKFREIEGMPPLTWLKRQG